MSEVLKVASLLDLYTVLGERERVIVSFGAPSWCVPCKRLAPHIANLAGRHEDATFVEVDVDAAEDIKNAYDIQSVPTVLYFRHGHTTETITSRTAPTIERELQGIEDK